MEGKADFAGLRVNVGLVINGSVRELEKLVRELEARRDLKLVFVRTSAARLRVVEEEARP